MYIKTMIIALAAGTLSLLPGVQSTYYFGSCSDIKLKSPFNLNLYSGLWYEHERDKGVNF